MEQSKNCQGLYLGQCKASLSQKTTGRTGKDEVVCVCVCGWYLHKLLCVLMELFQYWQRLFRKAVLENALDDSAAVGVSGERKDLRRTEFIPY